MDEEKKRLMQKRMEEYQAAAMQSAAEQQLLHEQMQILKKITTQILDARARERLANIKMVKPDMALQLEVYLVQLYQAGHLRSKVTEEQLIAILSKLSGGRKEFKIRRR
ncbi:MAG: hypothetical protein HZB67_00470 [Candidatus Aenigmarchaeota archaeon]|nr:hypothetical protein [Candidatus Aenigmarchaeota archaeon]